jgi:acetyl-CoA/propionyl-CoA carboxylase, biotin carboxylase, biotin carboxyl carrier protein
VFDKILIANRGEIAVRIARTCRERGVGVVAVFSDVDEGSRHVAVADRSVHLPGVAPLDTYLNVDAIIQAAIETGAEAIHPGYGFLAESADFAQSVIDAGLVWIGPPPEATRAVGDKIRARLLAEAAGVPVVPGLTDTVTLEQVREFGALNGFPFAIKAAGGGGGRGLKVVHAEDEISDAYASARREAEQYFGSREVFVERYLDRPKHLEVQILAPNPDEAMWLGVRDCSMQRRHQKLIEETPSPRFSERAYDMGEAAVALSKASGYVNAGTAEFLVDEQGGFFFLEVNARLQVEHTVTEEVLGLDLVACQLQIAAGDPLGFSQADLETHQRGHAIECRINAEDPARGFLPSPGLITRYAEPDGLGVRVDSGYVQGDAVAEAYDSLIAKVVAWGNDREEARARMLRSLHDFDIEGVATTIAAHVVLLQSEEFMSGSHTTSTIEESGILDPLTAAASVEEPADLLLVEGRAVRLWNPAMSASAAEAVHEDASEADVVAPMQGTILEVLVEPGASVDLGDPIVVLEAMKMETRIAAPRAGKVAEVVVGAGQTVGSGQLLAVIE